MELSREYKNFFNNETDISQTVCRFPMYSYTAVTDKPILIRHYLHKCETTAIYGNLGPRTENEFCKIFIIIDAGFSFITENNLFTPRCGDVMLINGVSNVYRLHIYDTRDVNYYEIFIPKSIFKEAPQFKVLRNIFTDIDDASMISLSHDKQTELFRILCEIESAAGEKSEYSDNIAFSYLLQLAQIICDNKLNTHSSSSMHLNPPLRSAIKYISENYLSIQTTEEVAKHCHISVSYLCRIFKKYMNTSPVDYINNLKLSYAKYLLKSGHNVTEACYASGFNSYNYFITIFKKEVGKTPGEYGHGK